MRHIKTFENYTHPRMSYYTKEENKKSFEVMCEIKDILFELSDVNYDTLVEYADSGCPTSRGLYEISTVPVLGIRIRKDVGPLWNNDEEKMEFDDVILRLLKYATSEGYKYKSEISPFYYNDFEKNDCYRIWLYK